MKDYTELVKALRHCTDNEPSNWDCCNCPYQGEKCHTLLSDAAAAIEDLQAQLPKRGEWIRVREVDIPGEMHPIAYRCMCQTCRNEYVFPRIPQYCPDCGSWNTAKMEVQE